MQTDKFDVIVAGAGPAGSNLARQLSQKNYKVLLLEKSQEIGSPNFSSAGSPDYIVKDFSLPQSVVAATWDKFEIVTPKNSHIWNYKKARGVVLKFNKLKRFLTEVAAKNGAKVLVGTYATDLIFEGKKPIGVKFSGLQKGEAFAKIIVDASGPSGMLARQAGLRSAKLCPPSIGLEYIVTNVKFPNQNTISFYLGNSFAPKGYAWVFPMGKNEAKIGIGIYESSTFKHKTELEILNEFKNKLPYMNDAQPLELHGSTLFISKGSTAAVNGNIISIGDSAAQINPLGGEGVRHALQASQMAQEAIDLAMKKGNLALLENYQKEWKKYTGRKWQISYLLTKVVYRNFTDDMYDEALNLAKSLTPDEIFQVFFEYNFKIGLKALRGNLKRKMFALALKNRIASTAPF